MNDQLYIYLNELFIRLSALSPKIELLLLPFGTS